VTVDNFFALRRMNNKDNNNRTIKARVVDVQVNQEDLGGNG